jgi:hypothetical protein
MCGAAALHQAVPLCMWCCSAAGTDECKCARMGQGHFPECPCSGREPPRRRPGGRVLCGTELAAVCSPAHQSAWPGRPCRGACSTVGGAWCTFQTAPPSRLLGWGSTNRVQKTDRRCFDPLATQPLAPHLACVLDLTRQVPPTASWRVRTQAFCGCARACLLTYLNTCAWQSGAARHGMAYINAAEEQHPRCVRTH